MNLSFNLKKKEKKKGDEDSQEEFFFEEKAKEDPIVLTIENEDNFEDLVIKAEIKREIYSFRFFLMIIASSLRNASLLFFYMNFKFIFLKYFDNDLLYTKVATWIEFIGRIAKISSGLVFEIISLPAIYKSIYITNLVKNIIFVFFGQNFKILIGIYVVQKILEGFYYIYNFVFIFTKYQNLGSFLMKIFEVHKIISIWISLAVVIYLDNVFDFQSAVSIPFI
jgi:hypothetical protein